ncbi:hypothetical protein [Micromonospora haikouensis]|uniref:hypothetical protein n=1 Tax=Micromonospora haikouensis TaxID=686309 RepID=UPI00379491F9
MSNWTDYGSNSREIDVLINCKVDHSGIVASNESLFNRGGSALRGNLVGMDGWRYSGSADIGL